MRDHDFTTRIDPTDPSALPTFLVERRPPAALQLEGSASAPDTTKHVILGSAARITKRSIRGSSTQQTRGAMTAHEESWVADAWEAFDEVGELHFVSSTIASRASQAHLYIGEDGDDPDPTKSENVQANSLLSALGSPSELTQLVERAVINLQVSGEFWLVGYPKHLEEPEGRGDDARGAGLGGLGIDPSLYPAPHADPFGPADPLEGATTIGDLRWRAFSTSEISINTTTGRVTLYLPELGGGSVEAPIDDLWLIRNWRQHPRTSWRADSPVRASLPVLRELIGLTKFVGAQVDSRLAGAGILAVPESVSRAMRRVRGIAEDDYEQDPFTSELVDAMVTPIKNRDSAASVVPLVVTVPDDAIDQMKHIAFATPLDEHSMELREEAIGRLSLGLDVPPELLKGMGDVNHWSGWLVQEDVVNSHLRPVLALICTGLTTQYLRPALEASGMTPEQAAKFSIWFKVDHLVARPSRGTDALNLYREGALSDASLREALGFGEDDAPEQLDELNPAAKAVLDFVTKAPSLVGGDPFEGMKALYYAVNGLISGDFTRPDDLPAPAAPNPEAPATPAAEEAPLEPGPGDPSIPTPPDPAATTEGAPE